MAVLSYLLDSNILSEPCRRYPNDEVRRRLQVHSHEVCTASPVLHELRYGLLRMPEGKRRRHLTRYFEQVLMRPLTVLPYDREAASWHAGERARLTSRGRMPSHVDGQIAAIAMVNDLTVVTRNTADFADFADLRVENWFG